MSYLAYCICDAIANPRLPFPPGVDGRPVSLITARDLCVTVSPTSSGMNRARPEIERILAFERVVETFHRQGPVLPMRYGLVLDDELGAIEMLNRNRTAYSSALRELNGCVELGIRIIVECQETASAPVEAVLDHASHCSGVQYLAARKCYYMTQDRLPRQGTEFIEDIRDAFRGLYVKCKTEASPVANPIFRAPIMSLEFLVKRKNVNAFRQAFRMLNKRNRAKLLLSGPWPPYSFVPTHMGGDGC